VFEKRFASVSPQLFTVNGTTDGQIVIAADACSLFKVKQKVIISATGLPNLSLEIKEISNGIIYVGPLASAARTATPNTSSKPAVQSSILLRTDISAYTTALGAKIFADEQKRPAIDSAEIVRATYEEEPAVALRSIMVDDCGNKYNATNPFPVSFDGTINIGDVSIVEGGNTLKVNPDGSINVNGGGGGGGSTTPENVAIQYNEDVAVVSGVLTTIVSYTVPVGATAYLQRVLASGENIAKYQVLVNGTPLATNRTYFGSALDTSFNFSGPSGEGYLLNAGDVVLVQVLHNRPSTADFEATLEFILNPIAVVGKTFKAIYNENLTISPNVTTNLNTYTVPPSSSSLLLRVLVAGEDIAKYQVLVNGVVIATKRTYFGGSLNASFEFSGPGGGGLALVSGDVVLVQVTQSRYAPAAFESTIEVVET